jgi:hypothetical protein
MKLFVWNNPYDVRYGGSCLYVIANDVDEARKLAKEKCYDTAFGDQWKENKGVNVYGKEPTRVHELPHAECYEWEE